MLAAGIDFISRRCILLPMGRTIDLNGDNWKPTPNIGRGTLLYVSLLLAFLVPGATYAGGELQIVCQPGVKIYVDGVFHGTTDAAQEGLFIEGLSFGTHTVKASLAGYAPFVERVSVPRGRTLEFKIRLVKEGEVIEDLDDEHQEELERNVGILEVRAVPPRPKAIVYLDGEEKGIGHKRIKNVSSGSHTVMWVRAGKRISSRIDVVKGETLKIKADFRSGTVIDETSLEREGLRRRQAEAAEKARRDAELERKREERQRQQALADERLRKRAEEERQRKYEEKRRREEEEKRRREQKRERQLSRCRCDRACFDEYKWIWQVDKACDCVRNCARKYPGTVFGIRSTSAGNECHDEPVKSPCKGM